MHILRFGYVQLIPQDSSHHWTKKIPELCFLFIFESFIFGFAGVLCMIVLLNDPFSIKLQLEDRRPQICLRNIAAYSEIHGWHNNLNNLNLHPSLTPPLPCISVVMGCFWKRFNYPSKLICNNKWSSKAIAYIFSSTFYFNIHLNVPGQWIAKTSALLWRSAHLLMISSSRADD